MSHKLYGTTIDLHTHFLPEPYIESLERLGVNWTGGIDLQIWTPEFHLEFMNKYGIDVSVLSCLAEGGVYFGNQVEANTLARSINDLGAQIIAKYPTRFGVFGAIPLPSVDDAINEIHHIYDDLHLDGVYVTSHVAGIYIGDPRWERVLAELDRRNATVLMHPVEPQQVPDLPWQHWIYEYTFDTVRVFCNLMYNGFFDKYPNIKWIMSHGGGAFPYLRSRLVASTKLVEEYKQKLERPVEEYLRRVYYDTALASSAEQLTTMVGVAGSENIVFGTDWPYTNGIFEDEESVFSEAYMELAGSDRERISCGNALNLLPNLKARLEKS